MASSITINRLKKAIDLLLSGATIKFNDMGELGKIFDTAIQQIERLEESRDNYKSKYKELEAKWKSQLKKH